MTVHPLRSRPGRGPRLLLRADAGHRLGSGHVMRLAALAEAALDAGGHACLLIGGEPTASVAALRGRGLDAIALDGSRCGGHAHGACGCDTIVAAARDLDPDAVIVDGPHFDPSWVASLRNLAPVVASLDDRGLTPLPTSVVINPGFGAEALADRYPDATSRLLGRRFHLLRREFRATTHGAEPPADQVRRVLITMGGSDPVGATVRLLAVMPGTGLELTVVLGPGFRDHAALFTAASLAEARGHHVVTLEQPRSLPRVLAACDLAVSAAGGTLAELAYLGRPTYAVAIVDDQVELAARQWGAGLIAGGHPLTALSDAALADDLADLLADAPRRRALAAAASSTIDGLGPSRILAALASPTTTRRTTRTTARATVAATAPFTASTRA